MTDEQAELIANAIREGFRDLGDRIAQGTNPENVAMSLKMVADGLQDAANALRDAKESD